MTKASARAKKQKELASYIREAQGTSRCVYKPALRPEWWPANIDFISAAKLSAESLGVALEAAKQSSGAASRNVPDGGSPSGAKSEKQETAKVELESAPLIEKAEEHEISAVRETPDDGNHVCSAHSLAFPCRLGKPLEKRGMGVFTDVNQTELLHQRLESFSKRAFAHAAT